MSVADKITRLQNSKTAIAGAITAKGGTVESGDGFEDFADAVSDIPVGLTGSDLDGGGTRTYFCRAFQECVTLTSIPQLDTSNADNFASMFQGCYALTYIPPLDTSKNTACNSMFQSCRSLTSIPQINTSVISSLNSLCNGCWALTSFPQIDTSNCIDFGYMFRDCKALITIPQLDTSKGTNFLYMFHTCSALTTIPQLDLTSATNVNGMFGYCYELTEISFTGSLKITGLSLSNSKKLTIESLRSLINVLETKTSGTFNVTVGSTNLAKLTEDDLQQVSQKGWVFK